ncbi:MAG: D-alanyl-D-alanine carboxypeptidase family protein [Gammaproteobacteria bacterium]|nr:D-alanyl-D-alanine carboxypeptidase family protein [Gammaproteobacteria bacterium]
MSLALHPQEAGPLNIPTRIPFALFFAALMLWSTAHAATPRAPDVAGTSHVLVDFHSGRVLSAKEPDLRVEPASLTKMMTTYVVLRELERGAVSMDDEVLVSEKAWRMIGSRMFIEVGKRVSVEDLLKGVIIQSGNDASVALAEHVAGSEESFADLMNQTAKRLGLEHSHFVNSTGLPHEDHYTTAADMARLAAALIRDFPEHYSWHAVKSFTYNDIAQNNRNRLLWQDDSVDGVKTGHTEAAGYCLVVSAKREGMRLISAVMGTSSQNARTVETRKLLNWGFRFFETRRLYGAGEELSRIRVWKGEPAEVPAGLAHDLHVTVPRGRFEAVAAEMTLDGEVLAPVTRGQRLGLARVRLGDEALAEAPLVALGASAEGGLWTRLVDHVRLMMQ